MRSGAGLSHLDISACFNAGLGRRYGARMTGGAEEPEYLPGGSGPALIRYTRDHAASALHELAHWCLAGRPRRNLPDYGYWYVPPPRSSAQQQAFMRVEMRVQALEARFAAASGVEFQVSLDDPGMEGLVRRRFARQVRALATDPSFRLPPRARQLLDDLQKLREAVSGRRDDDRPERNAP